MTRCSVCPREATHTWINPSNERDVGHYCQKHFNSINKSFNNFSDLKMLVDSGNLHVLENKI